MDIDCSDLELNPARGSASDFLAMIDRLSRLLLAPCTCATCTASPPASWDHGQDLLIRDKPAPKD